LAWVLRVEWELAWLLAQARGAPSTSVAMMRNRMPSFEEFPRPEMSMRDVVGAWIIIVVLLAASLIGLVLDKAATIAP
jgi:hypothetical protein